MFKSRKEKAYWAVFQPIGLFFSPLSCFSAHWAVCSPTSLYENSPLSNRAHYYSDFALDSFQKIERAVRLIERAPRDMERALRNTERALRDTERALRNVNMYVHAMCTHYVSPCDMKRALHNVH